jgi:hypothetical protein
MTDDRTPAEGPADETDRARDDGRATEAVRPDGAVAADHGETADQAETADLGQAADDSPTLDLGHEAPAGAEAHGAPGGAPTPASAPAPAPAPTPTAAPAPLGASGWAISALIVGIGAFLVGLVPVVGLLVALVGIALGIVALVRRRRTQSGLGLGVTGVVLSGVAAVTNVVVVAALAVVLPIGATLAGEFASARYGWDSGQGLDGDPYATGPDDDGRTDGSGVPADVATSCWSFSLPDEAWSTGDVLDDGACSASVEAHDDVSASLVDVVTVPDAVTAGLVPASSADQVASAVEALRTSWLPAIGTVVGVPEQTTLDGQPAALVRLATGPDLSRESTVVVAFSPADAAGATSLTLVTVGPGYGDDGYDYDYDDDVADDDAAATAAERAATARTLTSLTGTWDWATS